MNEMPPWKVDVSPKVSSSPQEGTGFGDGFFPFLTQARVESVAAGQSRTEVVTAVWSGLGKPKWILEVKLLVKKSGPGRTISSVYLLLKEKERESGQVPKN